MAVLIVNNTDRRIQYVAGAGATLFPYPFEIFEDGDLDVYQNQILLTLGVDYEVTNAGITSGGDVVLTVGAALNDKIVIVGDIAIDQLNDFTIKGNFIGTTVQTQYDKMTMIQQQLDTDLQQRGLQYNVFTTVKANGADNIIPTLAAGQFWQMNSTATGIFAAELDDDPGCSTLRSELISSQSGSDGAKIVGYFSTVMGETFVHDTLARIESKATGDDGASFTGYFDSSDNTEKTVAEKLNEAHQTSPLKNLIIGGDFTTNPFQRGTAFSPIVDNVFFADRFHYFQAGSMVLNSSVETSNPPTVAEAGIFVNKYVRMTVGTGASLGIVDFAIMSQKIEGFNWTRIAQRKFTVSFWVRSSVTGTYGVSARNGATDLSNVHNFTIDSINTWEKKVIIFEASPAAGTWNYENETGVEMAIALAAGTNLQTTTLESWISGDFLAGTAQVNFAASAASTFDLALVQVEEGEVETQFEIRTIQEELALCQRYFYKTYAQGVDPGSASEDGNGDLSASVSGVGVGEFSQNLTIQCPVTLRTPPAVADVISFSPITGAPNAMRDNNIPLDVVAVLVSSGANVLRITTTDGAISVGTQLTGHMTVDVEL